jgi:hypothetical protein
MQSTLLASVTRIIPKKYAKTSIPRLELLSAVVAANLWTEVQTALRKEPTRVAFWTDSQTSLCWIRGDASKYKTFVSNRIQKVQELTDKSLWRFCPGTDNPADIVSRGCFPHELVENQLWLHGPKWITDESEWPPRFLSKETVIPDEVMEIDDSEKRCLFFYDANGSRKLSYRCVIQANSVQLEKVNTHNKNYLLHVTMGQAFENQK